VNRIHTDLALDNAFSGAGVRIAILDTGIDQNHPDLRGRVDLAYSESFAITSDDLQDRAGHGTHIAGIIAGSGAMSGGLYRGIAPNADLVILKICSSGDGWEAEPARAVRAAMNAGVDIINFSNGLKPRTSKPAPWVWPIGDRTILEDAFAAAASAGILCVVAAGNYGPRPGSVARPGGLEQVLTVGAIDAKGAPLDCSGRGPFRRSAHVQPGTVVHFDELFPQDAMQIIPKPDLVAPGQIHATRALKDAAEIEELIAMDVADPHYVEMRGTSQAAAVVTGMMACAIELIRKHSLDLGSAPMDILRRLAMRAADKSDAPGSSSDLGHGVLVWPALRAVINDYGQNPEVRAYVANDSGPRLMP
jgi:subtilisin family serine protease